jgi:hypothetical protein
MALRTSDLSGAATLVGEGYGVAPTALDFVDLTASSDYSLLILPAGPFDLLGQEIEWFPTANGASFNADFLNAFSLSQPGTTALDLSSLGDGAQGSITEDPQLGSGSVVFSTGQLSEFLFVAAEGAIDGNDVKNVAQTAASKMDAVLGG